MLASNSVSEANHALSTMGLKLSETVCLDHVYAEGQIRHNSDFGRGHKALVRGKGPNKKSSSRIVGNYHNLSEEHKCSIIQAALDNAHAT